MNSSPLFTISSLSLVMGFATPCAATSWYSQWYLHNEGQSVCKTYPDDKCQTGTLGADVRFIEAGLGQADCSSVTIAVVDTGTDGNHPSLRKNIFPGSTTIGGQVLADGGMDIDMHGTHIAGVIAGSGTKEKGGVVGVCHKAKIVPIRVFSLEMGRSFTMDSDITAGINEAVKTHKAKIINLSVGGPRPSELTKTTMETLAKNYNVLFVIAAGNQAQNLDDVPYYPASYKLKNNIVVAATTQKDELAAFSNYGGNTIDIAAPGDNIQSSTPVTATEGMQRLRVSPYRASLKGTSMAAPLITGALALIWSQNPQAAPAEIKARVLKAVDKNQELSSSIGANAGRLNLRKLVNFDE